MRAAASVAALVAGVGGGMLTAYALGSDSPLVWTVAVIAGFGVGLLLMGHPAIHRAAWRLEQEASRREQSPPP